MLLKRERKNIKTNKKKNKQLNCKKMRQKGKRKGEKEKKGRDPIKLVAFSRVALKHVQCQASAREREVVKKVFAENERKRRRRRQ